jgi:hypothetical protein
MTEDPNKNLVDVNLFSGFNISKKQIEKVYISRPTRSNRKLLEDKHTVIEPINPNIKIYKELLNDLYPLVISIAKRDIHDENSNNVLKCVNL